MKNVPSKTMTLAIVALASTTISVSLPVLAGDGEEKGAGTWRCKECLRCRG